MIAAILAVQESPICTLPGYGVYHDGKPKIRYEISEN